MRLHKLFTGKIGHRLIPLMVLTLTTIVLAHEHAASVVGIEFPKGRQQRRSRPTPKGRTATQVNTSPALTRFKHDTHREPKTRLICSTCHVIPAPEAPDEIAAATKATIKGYPYHDSCLGCHRRTPPQFFRGATPSVCTVCHTRSGPRLTARDISPFPKQSEQLMEAEFPGYFPHDQRDHKRVNCSTCHMRDERAYAGIKIGESESPYKPADGTFKTSPLGHAACFKCHWKDEKPTKDDCAGCHLVPGVIATKPRNQLSTNAGVWFKSWPLEWPKRMSLKFNHESKDHDEECTSCHDLTRIETLDILKAEVPIATCASSKCHLSSTSRTSISKEMYSEEDDIAEGRNNNPSSKLGRHTCTGCHTNVIGSAPPPCSHLLLFADQAVDYPSVVKQSSERCKK